MGAEILIILFEKYSLKVCIMDIIPGNIITPKVKVNKKNIKK
jgi:hypothetical protein